MQRKIELKNNESTYNFPIIDFINSIYNVNYMWNISYIYFIAKNGSFNNTDYSVDSVENEINSSKPDGLFISWDKLMFILKSAFQIYDITISVFEDKVEIMKFEIFDCTSIEITTEDSKILSQFDKAIKCMMCY